MSMVGQVLANRRPAKPMHFEERSQEQKEESPMKLLARRFREDSAALTLESCEDGLNVLAYLLREDLAEGRAICRSDLDETRKIAAELMAHASKGLASHWNSPTSGLDA